MNKRKLPLSLGCALILLTSAVSVPMRAYGGGTVDTVGTITNGSSENLVPRITIDQAIATDLINSISYQQDPDGRRILSLSDTAQANLERVAGDMRDEGRDDIEGPRKSIVLRTMEGGADGEAARQELQADLIKAGLTQEATIALIDTLFGLIKSPDINPINVAIEFFNSIVNSSSAEILPNLAGNSNFLEIKERLARLRAALQ